MVEAYKMWPTMKTIHIQSSLYTKDYVNGDSITLSGMQICWRVAGVKTTCPT